MKARALGAMCVVVLIIIFTLGLWPFRAPDNHVKWIGSADGLSFDRYGAAFSLVPSRAPSSGKFARRSVEAWVLPEPYHSCSLFSFYNPQQSLHLSLRESITDFELAGYMVNPNRARRPARLYVDDVFSHRLTVFLAITSGMKGTIVYVEGVLAKAAPRFEIAWGAFEGQVILGDAPEHPDGWQGEIHGVAIYDTELAAAQILSHYYSWKRNGRPKTMCDERLSSLYLFNERRGNVVHDQVMGRVDLVIPEKYTVQGKVALEPVWKEFEISRSYRSAVVKNIVGFLPAGLCFYPFLVARGWRRPALATVIWGFLISLTIEVLQVYLPTRDSGTTDLITNALGTWLGVLTFRSVGVAWLQKHRSA